MDTAVKNENGTTLVVQVSVRQVYGNTMVYPANDLAQTLASLAGHRTLTRGDLDLIRKLPGVRIAVVSNPRDIPDWVLGQAGE